jgi:hypothetical protein
MSFLQPILLIGLPLALLPVIIHLINQHRHRTVRWAAMMFLLDAKKMTKGLARLRQILILTMRVLAIATLLFAASRPLAGGWISFAGGKADTLLVLLDRSASMEQQNLETGESKRSTALSRIADLIEKTASGSEIILIDSATLEPVKITDAAALRDLPGTAPTATSADIPAMLQKAVDYLVTNESGRTDIWLASDLRQNDWRPGSGQWQSLRSDLAARETVRLFLLTFPSVETNNTAVTVSDVKRRRTPDGLRLVMDLAIRRQGVDAASGDETIPVEITLNGTRTVEEMTVTGSELVRLGHTIELGSGNERGWGRIDLPADDNAADNQAFFVFDEPATRQSVIVSDDPLTAEAIRAAAAASTDPGVTHEATIIATADVARIPWEETALLFWQAPLPAPGTALATLLQQHLTAGRGLILLPPGEDGGAELFGVKWGDWIGDEATPLKVNWWRTESGLLANTRNGAPLPVGELSLFRTRLFSGDTQSLLKLESGESVFSRVIPDAPDDVTGTGEETSATSGLYVWGTLPRTDHSSLATEGVVFFVMTHRALEEGANAVSRARARETGKAALSGYPNVEALSQASDSGALLAPGLGAGAYASGSGEADRRLIALNRPAGEDDTRTLNPEALENLLAGVDYRQINDEVGSGASLASEIWRAFLIAMALALIAEAALCLPPKVEETSNPLRSMT